MDVRRIAPCVALVACGSCGTPSNEARKTLVVAYGADEYPVPLNKERLGRYPLNAGLCEPLVRLARDSTVAPALATRWERREPNEVRFTLRFGEKATLDTIVFRFIPDETTCTLALRSHDANAIVDGGASSAAAVSRVSRLHIVTAPPGGVIVSYMNLNDASPYQQLRRPSLHRVVAMAIDRRTLVTRVLGAGGAALVAKRRTGD